MNLLKRNKILLFLSAIVIVTGYSTYKYIYKPHKTIEDYEVKFVGTSEAFLKKVKEDAIVWQNVVVELSGTITSKDENGITMNTSIYCQFKKSASISQLKTGQKIEIKGRVIGYDDLLDEIKLDQTIIK